MNMSELRIVDLRDRPEMMEAAAAWFHRKWGIPEEAYRNQGIAGRLLDYVVKACQERGIEPLYLLTDHIGFYVIGIFILG